MTVLWWVTGNNSPQVGGQNGPVGYKSSPYWGFYWVVLTFVALLGIMSIVMAVVYNEFSAIDKKREASDRRRQRALMQQAFDALDRGKHGLITTEDYAALWQELRSVEGHVQSSISATESHSLFTKADTNRDGAVDFAQFLEITLLLDEGTIEGLDSNAPWKPTMPACSIPLQASF